jgi:hypothetical protein
MTDAADRDLLTRQVRELLNDVLSRADFPGSEELLRQVSSVVIVGGPVTMLDLRVGDQTEASAFIDGPIPLCVIGADVAGTTTGELLPWVNNGYLSCLEYAWWTDDPPAQLPSPDQIRVTRK